MKLVMAGRRQVIQRQGLIVRTVAWESLRDASSA
jgi:hypothetical protein